MIPTTEPDESDELRSDSGPAQPTGQSDDVPRKSIDAPEPDIDIIRGGRVSCPCGGAARSLIFCNNDHNHGGMITYCTYCREITCKQLPLIQAQPLVQAQQGYQNPATDPTVDHTVDHTVDPPTE